MIILAAAFLFAAQSQNLFCRASFADRGQLGFLSLSVDDDHRPLSMRLSLSAQGSYPTSDIDLRPDAPTLPGTLQGSFFLVRYTQRPKLPLTIRVYADGVQRWQKQIDVPFWPAAPGEKAVGKGTPGVMDYVSRADDGQPVTTPRILRVDLTDARSRLVGQTEIRYPEAGPGTALGEAIASIEAQVKSRSCSPPPPPID